MSEGATPGQYDVVQWVFRTPKGTPVQLLFRHLTSDFNTLRSCLDEDEYGLAGLDLEGVALDVGAHIGGVTIALAVDNPGLGVIAVEALPENAELLRANVERAGVSDRVRVINAAAGSERGGTQTMHFRYRGDDSREQHAFIGNISLFNGDGPASCPEDSPHEHVEVPVVTLEDLPPVPFVKIDCEGGEWEFLKGDLTDVRRIVGEWHPTDGHAQADMTALLSDFDVEYQPQLGLEPDKWMGFRAVRRA